MAGVSKGVQVLVQDLSKEFAANTGNILTGVNFKVTATGFLMMVKRVNAQREKEVLFCDVWTIAEGLEILYGIVYDAQLQDKWKADKF